VPLDRHPQLGETVVLVPVKRGSVRGGDVVVVDFQPGKHGMEQSGFVYIKTAAAGFS
jgi:hypothetical protein